jgi:hypothetical protein
LQEGLKIADVSCRERRPQLRHRLQYCPPKPGDRRSNFERRLTPI